MTTSRLRVALVAFATVLATTAAAAGFAIEDGDGRTVVAQFASAAPLVHGNEVKLDGVVVGEVLEMHPRDGFADVILQLDPEALPLHRDARVTIRPVSLLGERFVDLERAARRRRCCRRARRSPCRRPDRTSTSTRSSTCSTARPAKAWHS